MILIKFADFKKALRKVSKFISRQMSINVTILMIYEISRKFVKLLQTENINTKILKKL